MLGAKLAEVPESVVPLELHRAPAGGNFGERVGWPDERERIVGVVFRISYPGIVVIRGISWPSIVGQIGLIHVVPRTHAVLASAHRHWLWNHPIGYR